MELRSVFSTVALIHWESLMVKSLYINHNGVHMITRFYIEMLPTRMSIFFTLRKTFSVQIFYKINVKFIQSE